MNVLFTIDVEVWCGGWDDIDSKFPAAFQRYIYGHTPRGMFGLPFQLRLLEDHGLKGVCFVEPLFATRFGNEPLKEILGLIAQHNQEIQLHLHTEWVDEARVPLLDNITGKRQHLRYFSEDEQTRLIAAGRDLLLEAGAGLPSAFRAGSFAFDANTPRALAANGLKFDSSYNASMFGLDSGVMAGTVLTSPTVVGDVCEYPMTVFTDGTGKLRHTQLTACSFGELERLLWQALHEEREAFVLLSHNFECMNPAMNRADDIVVARLRKLLAFLEKNSDCFRVCGFNELPSLQSTRQWPPLVSPLWRTGARMFEQLRRRRFS